MWSTCTYKSHFIGQLSSKPYVAQSVEHQATNLKDVGSSSTKGKEFLFCILSLSTDFWQVDWSYTNEIKHDIHPTK